MNILLMVLIVVLVACTLVVCSLPLIAMALTPVPDPYGPWGTVWHAALYTGLGTLVLGIVIVVWTQPL